MPVKHTDPCYTFYVHWSGKKDCYPGTWSSWEAGPGGDPKDAGDPQGSPPPPPPDDPDDVPAPKSGGPLHGPAPGPAPNPAPGDGPGPLQGAPNGPASPSTPSGHVGGSPRTGANGASHGAVAVPVTDGIAGAWRRVDSFSARLESAHIDARGRLDAIVSLRNDARTGKLVARGDWTALAVDADGLGKADDRIWSPADGPPRDFDLMPIVAPGASVRVRFVIDPPDVRTTLAQLHLRQTRGRGVSFDLANVDAGGDRTAPAMAAGTGPYITGTSFDLRVDGTRFVAGRTELFFTARNRLDGLRYADGGALRVAAANGATSTGASYSIRGAAVRQTGTVPVEPGREVRLRALFDGRVAGPFLFDDGHGAVRVASSPVAEPAW